MRKLLDLVAPHVTGALCVLTAFACASSSHSMVGENEVIVKAVAGRSLSEYGAAACDSYLNTHHQVCYHHGPVTFVAVRRAARAVKCECPGGVKRHRSHQGSAVRFSLLVP
jgi:hypothetical protein